MERRKKKVSFDGTTIYKQASWISGECVGCVINVLQQLSISGHPYVLVRNITLIA